MAGRHAREPGANPFNELGTGADASERLRAVFDTMASAVLVTRRVDGRIVELNAAALQLFGVADPSGLVGREMSSLAPALRELLAVTQPGERHRLQVTLQGGRQLVLGYSTTATTSGRYLVTVLRDLSQVIEAEARRRRAEQLAQVGEMAARLSHEIKNPLSSILAGLELLNRDATVTGEHGEIVAGVLAQAKVLSASVRGLLDGARPSPFAPRVAELGAVVGAAVDAYDVLAQKNHIHLRRIPSRGPIAVIVDPTWMARAISNLVINAIEATSARGNVSVRWGLLDEAALAERFPGFAGNAAFIQVEDDGVGMDAQVLRTIFQPFYTTKPRGTGLGLAMTLEVVDFHGGTLRVASNPDWGTSFELALPVPRAHSPCWTVAHTCRQDCTECPAFRAGGYCCWAITQRGLGMLPESCESSCRTCEVFYRGSLQSHAHGVLETVSTLTEPPTQREAPRHSGTIPRPPLVRIRNPQRE